jgi:hypothetical protein
LSRAKLEEMLSEIGRQEAGWKKLNDYLKLTGAHAARSEPPETFRTAAEQTRGLKWAMTDLEALVHADLRDPALRDRLETVVADLKRLRGVEAHKRLLKQAERLQTLTDLDDIRKHIREAARQCRSEMYLFDPDVFSSLARDINVLIDRFKAVDAQGGRMWEAVSKDYCEEVYRLACIHEPCPESPDLETLAERLDELNKADKDFIRAVNQLWEKRPFINADRPFDPDRHAGYFKRFPKSVPPFRRAYLYFEHRLASVASMRSVIEQSRHKLPDWVGRYLDEGVPPCAEES